MPHQPSINIRELKKKGVIDEEQFYQELAAECGHISVEMAKRFYGALVKVTSRKLKADGVSRLPHMGDFALVYQKEKTALVGTRRMFLHSIRVLKFYPHQKWRQYFSSLNHTPD